jgi:hypothetical protein
MGSKVLANSEARPDIERNPEEVAEEQNRVLKVKIEVRIEAEPSSRCPPNRTIRFPEPDHMASAASGQKRMSRTTMPWMAPAPRWCPPGLTPSQRRRIQWMRAQRMREEAAKKERDEYFNIIPPVIPMRQEWRVKEKVDTHAPTTSNDDTDLLDDDEAPLIKDGSLPPTGMDINMVFTLLAEFRGVEEEVT